MNKLLLYGCFFCFSAAAQEVPATTEQQMENLGEETPDDDALLQNLAYYKGHPLNLNTATAEDLQALRLLNPLQIENLIRYCKALGPLIDMYELQAVPGFDLLTLRRLKAFVFVDSGGSVKEALLSRFKGGDAYLLARFSRVLEKARGYDGSKTSHYLGDRNRLLLAYRYQHKTNLYYGLVADKDAGEPFLRRAQKTGFDFYAVHFFARNLGRIKALALGDYVVNLGQGLTQWQSLAFGKSADVLNVKRQSPVLLPYRSAGEFLFNRGAGLTLGFGNWDATAFVSYKKFSGNLVDDSLPHFTSFNTSGYHRTTAEAADRLRLADFSMGGNVAYRRSAFQIRLNAVWHRFSRPLQKSSEPYNYYAFSGRESGNAGLNYSFTLRNAHFFGEVAADNRFHTAAAHGLLLSLDRRLDLAVVYRRFSPAYQSLFGNAFSESGTPSNEEGLYAGIVLRPAAGWQVSAYADAYRFPFLRYRVSAPARAADYLAQLTWQPSRQTEVYLRYRSETKALNESSGAVIRVPEANARQNLRFHFSLNRGLVFLKGRAEITQLRKGAAPPEQGFLTYLEAGQNFSSVGGVTARLQYFETAGYDSRIYAYESEVLYAFSIPAFFEKGFRYYVLFRLQPAKRVSAWLRFAQTVYPGKRSNGSGLDEIAGGRKSEVRLQLRCEF